YERDHPGDMIHIDIKKLGRFERVGHRITGDRTGQSNSRGVGWEFVHVCIDDASRVAFSQILPDERKEGETAGHIEDLWSRSLGSALRPERLELVLEREVTGLSPLDGQPTARSIEGPISARLSKCGGAF